MSMRRLIFIVIFASCSAAKESNEPETEGPLVYQPCALGTRVGRFRIEAVADPAPGFASVSGTVATGLVPADVPEVIHTVGDCRLVQTPHFFCDPSCSAAETCAEGGHCIPYPRNQNVGTVEVTGLARPVRMQPTARAQYFNTSLAYPGYQANAAIHLRAEGGQLLPFSLRGAGVSPLVVADESLMLARDQPFVVNWTPDAGASHIELGVSIDQHGASPSMLVCDVADTGSLSVPDALVTALLANGTSGYPQLTVTRRTADSTMLAPGCVELTVESAKTRAIQVAGHIPCRKTSDCPAGLNCDTMLESCR